MALPPFFAQGRQGPPPPQPPQPPQRPPSALFGCPPPPLPSPAFPPPLPQQPGPFHQPPLALQPRVPAEASRVSGGPGGSFFPVPPPPMPPPPQFRPFPVQTPASVRGHRLQALGLPGARAGLRRLGTRPCSAYATGSGPGAPRTRVGPNLGEVSARLRAALRLVRRLRNLGQSLREAEASGVAWASLHAQAVPLRAELAERLQPLAQAAYVGEARRRLERVRSRRLWLRERAREREQEIDRCRVKCVREVEEKKREQELKAAADGVLSEVRKKQSDTQRMVDILPDETFENHLHRLRKLIKKRSELYEAEERALRVMLEGEQEEERKRELEKKQRKEKEKLLLQKREIESKLFGDPDEFPLAHLLVPFCQYYLQAEHSLPALIQIRHDWDQYLVPADHPKGNSIPQGWVLPPIPSNSIWAMAVKLH
ncbi:programmed cell death protein 7 [Sigmodon hispidus]